MNSLIETIADKLHNLPSSKLQEVLDFVEFLAWREHRSNLDKTGEFELLADQLADEFTAQINSNSNSQMMPSVAQEFIRSILRCDLSGGCEHFAAAD